MTPTQETKSEPQQEAKIGEIGIRSRAIGSFPPKLCLGRPSLDGYFAALCPHPRYSLDHRVVLSCLARQRN